MNLFFFKYATIVRRNVSPVYKPHRRSLKQPSPTFLAAGTGFLEDNFPTDWGWGHGFRLIQAHLLLSTPNKQAQSAPGGWGPLLYRVLLHSSVNYCSFIFRWLSHFISFSFFQMLTRKWHGALSLSSCFPAPLALLFLFLPCQFRKFDLKAVSQLPEQLAVPNTQLCKDDFLLVRTTDALMWYRYLPFRSTVRHDNLFFWLTHTLTVFDFKKLALHERKWKCAKCHRTAQPNNRVTDH